MRRFTAILMFVLIGSFLAAPLLALASSDPESNLPACCRRNGHHHCAMMDQAMPSAGSGTQARQTPQRCASYPRATTASAFPFHGAPAASAAHYAQIASHPTIHAQTNALYRLSLDRSRQKRGPPASSL
jgi:hypothetical protein